ncbi:hypothetical protein [Candidatus Nanohalovita haloferacivicina]|uniref:hypothetical protein n=1 Tax=Candidatus Nanohalovita haloferacivicina TaxID=2978046 RepID=UPI00325FD0E9|nr:hypothetical protein HBNXNv_0352 [Candidatus Nanohalobia archaeon BNXNv]
MSELGLNPGEKLWNRIADKIYHDHKRLWVKPTNITSDPEELRQIQKHMKTLEDKRLAADRSEAAWKLLSEDIDDYKEALNVDMVSPLFERQGDDDGR